MLDVEKGWEAFNNFENYLFIPDCEDFLQFTGKWNVRHQAAVDAGISYSNSLLAFKLLRNSNLSAPVQSRILSKLNTEFKDDCYNVHLITYLISKETQNKQNFKSVPKQVNSEQSLGCLPIEEKVDIPRETDPLYSDETIKLEYYNVEEEMVDNDKDEGIGEDDKETVTVNEGQAGNDKKKENPPRTIDQSDSENEGANEKKKGKRKLCKTPWEYSGSDPSDVDEPISTMPEVAMNHERASIYDSSALSEDKDFSPISLASNMATSIPENSVRGKGERLFEKSEKRRDVFNTLLESNQGILKVLHGMQKFIAKEFQNNRMSLQQNPVTEKPFKHVDTADQLKIFELRIVNDQDFFMAVKQYLSCKISGYSIYNAAYKILPEIISDVFAMTISWDKGSGKNATTRSIHLKHQYPHFASMLKEVIFRSQKFELEFEASPRAANTNFSHGIAKYLKNLRNKKALIKENENKKLKKNKIQRSGVPRTVGVSSCRPGTSKEIATPTAMYTIKLPNHNDIAASSKISEKSYEVPKQNDIAVKIEIGEKSYEVPKQNEVGEKSNESVYDYGGASGDMGYAEAQGQSQQFHFSPMDVNRYHYNDKRIRLETEFQGEYPDIHGNEFHDMDTGKVRRNMNGSALTGRAVLSSVINGNQF
ncbi:uncharacterized protein LOC111704773 isoform X4 [Eurytemora carolleeae]|uniref:uncharacterized protein LOC111704773 isoform X4 n=1 Tax=Eurytemora carolleeae TaxID=1294199 RepID=UPI000C779724|nr:uncharacterized protein LOC111704773 isoform X4 [Eurytemora carolleeae]|eukprot:XP_023332882.1 uncharacterized protein LOC111704773 isoform X4 [Eurytemora affinis]